LARYILGFAIQITSAVVDDASFAQVFHDLDPNQFPATVKVADNLPVPLDEEFAFGLELIIDGLAQELQRHPRRG
jgi:hypothetical protein